MPVVSTPEFEVRRNLPTHLMHCLDQDSTSGYCREWSAEVKNLQSIHPDMRTVFRETLLVTQKLNRSYSVDQGTRKEINQLVLKSFSATDLSDFELKPKKESPSESPVEDHVFSRFLNSVKESFDTRCGETDQFAREFQGRLSTMKISFGAVRVLKAWSTSGRGGEDFATIPASDLRTIVDSLYVLCELQFGSMVADIILSDAVLHAETEAKSGQLSIRDLL